jgi:2-oxoisovalerate dehydrogenase E1 component beta subunit
MAEKSMIETVRDTLTEIMAADERVLVLGEDVQAGGVFKATEGLLARFGPERVLDTPLAESSIAGIAIGAALNGLLPVAEIQFADFIYPAMNQIISEAARLRYRSNNGWGCPIVIRAPYGGGVHGGLYHSQSLEAFFAHVPGLKVVMPATPADMKGLLWAAVEDPDPVIVFEHKRTYRLIRGETPEGRYLTPIGKAEVRRRGDDLTVFTYGLCLHQSLEAAHRLSEEDGAEATVVDLRTVRPLDTETILEETRRTGKVLIVYEDNLTGGVGAEVAALIAEHAFSDLDAPIRRLAGPDIPAVPYSPPLEAFFMPSPEKILSAMRELAAF